MFTRGYKSIPVKEITPWSGRRISHDESGLRFGKDDVMDEPLKNGSFHNENK
jgi:hypothetical protein